MKNKKKILVFCVFLIIVTSFFVVFVSCVKKPKKDNETKVEKKVDQSVIDNFAYNFVKKTFPSSIKLNENIYYKFDINAKDNKDNQEKNYAVHILFNYDKQDISIKVEDKDLKKKILCYDGKSIFYPDSDKNSDKIKKDLNFKKIIEYFSTYDENKINKEGNYSNLGSYFFKQFTFFFDQVFLGVLPKKIKIKADKKSNFSENDKILSFIYDAEGTYEKQDIISIKTKDLDTTFLSFLPLDFIYSVKELKSKFEKSSIQFLLDKNNSNFNIIFREKGKNNSVLEIKTKLSNIASKVENTNYFSELLDIEDKDKYNEKDFFCKKSTFDINVKNITTINLKAKLELVFNPNSIFEYLNIEKKSPKILEVTTPKKEESYKNIKNKFLFEISDTEKKQIFLLQYDPSNNKNDFVSIAIKKNIVEQILKNKNKNIKISDYIKEDDVIKKDGIEYLLFQTSLNVFINNISKILVSPDNILDLSELLKKQQNNMSNSIYQILEFLEVLNRVSKVDKNGIYFDKNSDKYNELLKKYKIEDIILTLIKYLPGDSYEILKSDETFENISIELFNDIEKYKIGDVSNLILEAENKQINIYLKENSLEKPLAIDNIDIFINKFLKNNLEINLKFDKNDYKKAQIVSSNRYLERVIIEKDEKYNIYKFNLLISEFSNKSIYESLKYIYLNDNNESKLFSAYNISFYVKVKA